MIRAIGFTLASLLLLFALFSYDVKAQMESPCDNPLVHYNTITTRNVTIYFTLGQKPYMVYSGPAIGPQLVGRFGDQATGYTWMYVWAEDDPAPTLQWHP